MSIDNRGIKTYYFDKFLDTAVTAQEKDRMNTNASALEQQAIQAAKNQDWQSAITYNTQIVEMNPEDVGALIRLGVAYAQLGDNKEAKNSLTKF